MRGPPMAVRTLPLEAAPPAALPVLFLGCEDAELGDVERGRPRRGGRVLGQPRDAGLVRGVDLDKLQPTMRRPDAASRTEVTRTSASTVSAKKRPWKVSRSPGRSTRLVAKATPSR